MENNIPSIRLDQFMKLAGLARSGGEAKHLVQGGQVRVNGVIETHRTRKLHPGDRVDLGGHVAIVDLAADNAPRQDA